MILALILGFILGAVAILFILENNAVVALSFMQWQFETTIALVVILSILFGILLSLLMILPGAIGNSFRMRRLRKHNEALAHEAEAQRRVAETATDQLAATQTFGPGVVVDTSPRSY